MKPRNERTGTKAAKIAAKVLGYPYVKTGKLCEMHIEKGSVVVYRPLNFTGEELKTLAASDLTQSPDTKEESTIHTVGKMSYPNGPRGLRR